MTPVYSSASMLKKMSSSWLTVFSFEVGGDAHVGRSERGARFGGILPGGIRRRGSRLQHTPSVAVNLRKVPSPPPPKRRRFTSFRDGASARNMAIR
jgi:hypothetical protein